jgi:hypothetical protein
MRWWPHCISCHEISSRSAGHTRRCSHHTMIDINIPGYGRLRLQHLVMDYNGTLALDGRLLPGVVESIKTLAKLIKITTLRS